MPRRLRLANTRSPTAGAGPLRGVDALLAIALATYAESDPSPNHALSGPVSNFLGVWGAGSLGVSQADHKPIA